MKTVLLTANQLVAQYTALPLGRRAGFLRRPVVAAIIGPILDPAASIGEVIAPDYLDRLPKIRPWRKDIENRLRRNIAELAEDIALSKQELAHRPNDPAILASIAKIETARRRHEQHLVSLAKPESAITITAESTVLERLQASCETRDQLTAELAQVRRDNGQLDREIENLREATKAAVAERARVQKEIEAMRKRLAAAETEAARIQSEALNAPRRAAELAAAHGCRIPTIQPPEKA